MSPPKLVTGFFKTIKNFLLPQEASNNSLLHLKLNIVDILFFHNVLSVFTWVQLLSSIFIVKLKLYWAGTSFKREAELGHCEIFYNWVFIFYESCKVLKLPRYSGKVIKFYIYCWRRIIICFFIFSFGLKYGNKYLPVRGFKKKMWTICF